MRMRLRLPPSLSIAAAVVGLSCTVFATNYYVSSSGNATNPCTAALPCYFTHALAISSEGDTFNISGTIVLSSPIAAKNNQTFIGTSKTIITGGITLCGAMKCYGPDKNGNWSVPSMMAQGPVASSGICDPGWEGCVYPEDLFVDGKPLQHVAGTTLPKLTASTWWFDYPHHTIYFHLNPAGHVIETSVTPTMFAANCANGVTIQNLTVQEFASQIGQGGGIDPNYGQNATPTCGAGWTLKNVTVTLNHSNGIRAGFGMTILDSTITWNGDLGISAGLPAGNPLHASGLLIQGSTITYNNYAHVAPGFQAGGIKTGNSDAVRIIGNNVSYNWGHGIHFDDNSLNGVIDGNTVEYNSDPQGQGSASESIVIEISGKTLIRNNRARYNGTGAKAGPNYQIVSADSSGVEAYCNVIETDTNPYTQSWAVFASARGVNKAPPNQGMPIVSTGNNFHHNTVIFDGQSGGAGFLQGDTQNQPQFFQSNTAPDFNMYHAADQTARFMYDGNNSGQNTNKAFAVYQSSGADVHGTLDTVYKSGFPTIAIPYVFVGTPSIISATASDSSGMVGATWYLDWKEVGAMQGDGPYSLPTSAMTAGQHVVAVMGKAKSGVQVCQAVTVSQTCNCNTIQVQP